jgi:hypothetical protein
VDKIAAYEMLLENHPLWEKTAFSASKLLPAGTALGGSVLGGIGGAMSTEDPAERKKRGLMGAVAGGLTGGLGGEVLRRGKLLDQATDTAKSLRNRADELGEQVGSLESRNSGLEGQLGDISRRLTDNQRNLNSMTSSNQELQSHLDLLPGDVRDALRSRVESGPMFKKETGYLANYDRRIADLEHELFSETDPKKKQQLRDIISEESAAAAGLLENLRKHRFDMLSSNSVFRNNLGVHDALPELPDLPSVQSFALRPMFPDKTTI